MPGYLSQGTSFPIDHQADDSFFLGSQVVEHHTFIIISIGQMHTVVLLFKKDDSA
jgi:hypothetical protein